MKNDYRLSPSDSARITCDAQGCNKPAITGQNNGSAPFWYHCDHHADNLRTTGHVWED